MAVVGGFGAIDLLFMEAVDVVPFVKMLFWLLVLPMSSDFEAKLSR